MPCLLTDNRLLITSLRSDTTYTVVVDAVKTEIMKNELVDEDQGTYRPLQKTPVGDGRGTGVSTELTQSES